jgi:hypothetical protein
VLELRVSQQYADAGGSSVCRQPTMSAGRTRQAARVQQDQWSDLMSALGMRGYHRSCVSNSD